MQKTLPRVDDKEHLLTFDELPEWRRLNPYITHGYRPIKRSWKYCLSSLAFFHTETGSQYTHFLPYWLATAECVRLLGVYYGWIDTPFNPLEEDVLVFGAFFGGAFACMLFSTAYHTFMNYSEDVHMFTKQFDFLGIICLIWGSLVPTIFYTFTCEVDLMRKYLTALSAISAVMAAVLLSPIARQPWAGSLITPGFIALAATGIVPLVHGLQMFGWQHMQEMVSIQLVIAQGVIYLFGTICMATRMPECLWPGKFNSWGHSHHLFHAAVVVAAFVQYQGIKQAFLFQHKHPTVMLCPMQSVWKNSILSNWA